MNQIETIARRLFGDNPPCKCGGAHIVCLGCAVCRAAKTDQIYDPAAGIASIIDATLLRADATQAEVNELCDLANDHKCEIAKLVYLSLGGVGAEEGGVDY